MIGDCGNIVTYCCHYTKARDSVVTKTFHIPVPGCNLELYICSDCYNHLLQWCKKIERNLPEPWWENPDEHY